jgi:TM2 domain-containing membrane protein YozV
VAQSEAGSKKLLAGLLGILLGWTGAHRFVLGDTTGGVIRLVIGLVTCGVGGIIGLIEGIIYLTKSDEDFQKIYIEGKKAWF